MVPKQCAARIGTCCNCAGRAGLQQRDHAGLTDALPGQAQHQRGAARVTCLCLLGAPEGIERLEASLGDVEVDLYLAAVDERLDERSYIVPGLGDAGDRLYGLAE